MKFLDKLLDYYNISNDEYLLLTKDVNEGDIPFYKCLNNIELVKEKIFKAISDKKKILIYGDYDCDGIMATSILVNTFNKLNYEVDYYIPSRYIDGYGLTVDKVIKAKEIGYQLIITVDNGVSAIEAINKCKELGIDIIVTDHHEYNNFPNDVLLLHPKESKLKYMTSGGVVAFYLSYALLNAIEPYLLTLAATSVISDVMIMKGENRNIVKLGLKYLNKYRFDKYYFLSELNIYDESTLSMKVIPKINAVGRIERNKEVNILVRYFTSASFKDLINIKDYINSVNERKKNLANLIIDSIHDEDASALVFQLDIISGMTGLVASRLLNAFDKPTIIFAKAEPDNTIRGSMRSKNGLNVLDFISNNKDLFVEYGGHNFAAGIIIHKDKFNEFKKKFIEYSTNHKFEPSSDNILINVDEINLTNYEMINKLSPFGEGFREPTFIIKDFDTSLIKRMGKNNEHLLVQLNGNDKIIGFNYDFNKITSNKIDFVGTYKLNKFKNNISINFSLIN